MLSVKKLIESARMCLGWPYVSPGSNNQKGIDCSGLFVKCFRDQGASIYHGSNTIFRKHCSETGKLRDVNQLKPGMAVFKLKSWRDTDKSNRWYGTDPGNLSHIGMVTSVNPLEITHASTGTMCVTTDSKIGNWAYWGLLKNVDYGTNVSESPTGSGTSGGGGSPEKSSQQEQKQEAQQETGPVILTATVCADNGKPVKLRQKASTKCNVYDEIPVGTVVTVTTYKDDWCKVTYKGRKGWFMMTKFLAFG